MDYYITIKGSEKYLLYTWTIKSFHMSQSDLQWIKIKTKVVVVTSEQFLSHSS